jgi:capsid protein
VQLDPLKEASADMIDVNLGVKSRTKIINERTGGSFAATHTQLALEESMRRDAGLVTANSPSAALQPGGQDKQDKANQDNPEKETN